MTTEGGHSAGQLKVTRRELYPGRSPPGQATQRGPGGHTLPSSPPELGHTELMDSFLFDFLSSLFMAIIHSLLACSALEAFGIFDAGIPLLTNPVVGHTVPTANFIIHHHVLC